MATTVEEKDPDVPKTYHIDLWEVLVKECSRSYGFIIGDVTRAPRDTGFLYVCSKAGRTSAQYPVFSRNAGESVIDGSVIWTTTDPASANDPIISSVTWTLESGLTLDAQGESDHVASITVSGGTAGNVYEATASITPAVGEDIEVTIIIPVSQQ